MVPAPSPCNTYRAAPLDCQVRVYVPDVLVFGPLIDGTGGGAAIAVFDSKDIKAIAIIFFNVFTYKLT